MTHIGEGIILNVHAVFPVAIQLHTGRVVIIKRGFVDPYETCTENTRVSCKHK